MTEKDLHKILSDAFLLPGLICEKGGIYVLCLERKDYKLMNK